MDQPVPAYSENDLSRLVEREFGPGDRERAMTILARYGTRPWHRESLRVRIACLICAKGDLVRLEEEVDAANRDYRDVLVAAEYPRYADANDEGSRVAAIERDWRDLKAWIERS